VGSKGQQGRRAPPPGGALGAAQGGRQHHRVEAPGRRISGRVSAVCGMQGDAGAVRPTCDLHGGTRAVVLWQTHRPRRSTSEAHIRAADAHVQGRKQLTWKQRSCGSSWCDWRYRQHMGPKLLQSCSATPLQLHKAPSNAIWWADNCPCDLCVAMSASICNRWCFLSCQDTACVREGKKHACSCCRGTLRARCLNLKRLFSCIFCFHAFSLQLRLCFSSRHQQQWPWDIPRVDHSSSTTRVYQPLVYSLDTR
jgi:hypothetical protein